MKKNYEGLEMEIIFFDTSDVIDQSENEADET